MTPSYDEFKYWFKRLNNNEFAYVDKSNDSTFVSTWHKFSDETTLPEDVKQDFVLFQSRPEYTVGELVPICAKVENTCTYDTLLKGAYLIRMHEQNRAKNPDEFEARVDKFIDWLRAEHAYDAPASTQYHEAYDGGLVAHSLKVYNKAVELSKCDSFSKIPIYQYTLCALMHDWCKIDLYTPYQRNVKNEETGKWEQVTAYKTDIRNPSLGHGVTSMFLASKLINLSVEEAAAIRWHQGRWDVSDVQISELDYCNRKYPLVHMLQFADQLATTEYNIMK